MNKSNDENESPRHFRTQALHEGNLIDISEMADKVGFKIPVAVTKTVWENYIQWTEDDNRLRTFQDPSHRQWNILYFLHRALHKLTYTDCIYYEVYILPRHWFCPYPVPIELKATIELGDKGESVITIRVPYEE